MTHLKNRLALFLLFFFLAGFAAPVHAQEDVDPEVAAAVAAAQAKSQKSDKSLWDMWKAGGWAMYPLAFLSIAAISLIAYNFMALKANTFLRPDLVEEVNKSLAQYDIPGARTICQENPSAITNIVEAGLARANDVSFDTDNMEKAMEEASSEELSNPYVLVNYLSVIASLAPMVGLLGTVSGMVKAFNVIATQGTGDPKLLADNISEALITTASGMIVGIPAMFFFFFFKNKYGKIVSSISRVVGNLMFSLIDAVNRLNAGLPLEAPAQEAVHEGQEEAAE